ncbi:MAG: NGG1p interacting factor NIF3, partial [Candidatus Omnitrophica bacterium]|nr:NGG1p interacting factor NIF3 [Candidatus Omnitrophota bacterium]
NLFWGLERMASVAAANRAKSVAQIKKILAGIDIDTSELLLADRIRSTHGLDLVLSHHPQGKALAGLYGVMQVQADILRSIGLDQEAANGLLEERRQQVKRRLQSGNHNRAVDAARLLGMPFVCCHTPADNHVYSFINALLKRKKPGVLKDIVDILLEVPEYSKAAESLCGPHILLGDPKRPVGRILVEMTGGTEGPQAVYKHLYRCGIRTLVSMHLSEDHLKCVTAANINVVIAGHISSDNLGMNLLLDNISKHGDIEVLEASGFMRIKRGSKR